MIAPHPPKVAIIVATAVLSGAENRATKIYTALRERDYPAELWINPALRTSLARAYPEAAGQALDRHLPDKSTRWLRPFQRSRALWSALEHSGLPARLGSPALERQLAERDIDLVHIFLDTQIAHVRDVPTLFELTSPDIADIMGTRPSLWRRSHTAYHAVSAGVARRFSNLAPDVPLIEAPGPFFQPRQSTLPAGGKSDTIIFAHRFIRRKNALLFAEAASRFVQLRPGWRVRILGVGELDAEIRDAVVGMEDRIEVGFDPNLPDALASSRIFVSLIEPDNYPSQSVMEAMAAGNALLLSDTGDSAERFMQGNGMLTGLDVDQVLETLLVLTADDQALKAMGEQSRALAQQRFNADHYLDHLIEVYKQVASRRASP